MGGQDALLKRARDTLGAADALAESEYFADSLSRAHYAAFYAA